MPIFIGQAVAVECAQETGWKRPVAFEHRGARYQVADVEDRWEDHSFPVNGPRRPRWYHRRHRTYYQVRTTQGRRFILYWDRGGKTHQWVLLKEVDATPGP